MSDYLISLFIDDEMDLDEKIEFVKTVHDSRAYTLEAVALLDQEKLLYESAAESTINAKPGKKKTINLSHLLQWWQPLAGFATALILLGIASLLFWQPDTAGQVREQRFVLYLPQAEQANIIGTFTDWNPVPMHKIGSSGYWTLTLTLPEGEYRYSYLVENGERMADPTVTTRERDDFGGENTVIVVGGENEPVS